MTRRKGYALLDLFVAMAIGVSIAATGLMIFKVVAGITATLESSDIVTAKSPPTISDMEKAAKKAAKEHDIYDRVAALATAWPSHDSYHGRVLAITIPLRTSLFGSSEPAVVRLWFTAAAEAVEVRIRGKIVHEQVGGEIKTYLGMGEWEYLLGDIEHKIAADREEMFRKEAEKRFGPLLGWGLVQGQCADQQRWYPWTTLSLGVSSNSGSAVLGSG